MSAVLEVVLLAALAVVLVPVCVLLVQVACATIPGRHATLGTSGRPRLAVLVPAHDEAAGIGATLATVSRQLEPGDRLVVVADNCSDDTAGIARAAGAEVVVRIDPSRRGKGYALDAGIRHLASDPPEIVVVVDADCRVAAGAIDRVARASAATGRPAQALYLMEVPEAAGPLARIAGFAWIVKNNVRPLGFLRLGLPCQLTGSGMALPWQALASAHLASGQIVEDMKLGIDLARSGTPPLFCPAAVVWSRFPESAEGRRAQRTRWEHGHLGMIAAEVPRLLFEGVTGARPALAALALDLCVPPLALLALLVCALLAASAIHALAAASVAPLALAAATALMFAAAVLLSWRRFGAELVPLAALPLALAYALRKLPLYLRFLVRREREWVRTRRDVR